MKKIWIITEMFHPDETATSYILTKIAEKLSKDFDVNVICGPVDDSSRLTTEPLTEKVNVIRSNSFNFNKNNILLRCLRFIGISLQLTFTALRRVKKDDKVLIVTNPAPMLLLFSFIKKIKGMELSILVHDVFPENTVAANIIKNDTGLFYKMLKWMFDKAYSSADKLIVLGRDMKDVILQKTQSSKKTPKIFIIENWADIDNILPTKVERNNILGIDCTNKIVLQYAGNIGRVQGLELLLECLLLSNNKDIHLALWGDGAVLPELKRYANENNMQNVSFHGAYMRSQQNEILNACDISIITLSENMYGLGVPSKSYNIMAAGSAILFIGHPESEISLCVKDYNLGYTIDNNKEQLIEFLKNLKYSDINSIAEMKTASRMVAEKYYSQEAILSKFTECFLK